MSSHIDRFRLCTSSQLQDGYLRIFTNPRPDRYYSLGLDFAYGIQAEGRDFDAGVLLDDRGEQVAEMAGRWGERFGDVLWPLIEWYRPFVVGERAATGLPVLRDLFGRGAWIYYERDENKASRPRKDLLGVPTSQKGILLRWLQKAIAPADERGIILPSKVKIRSGELLNQCCRYCWRPRTKSMEFEEARDEDLYASAPSGQHDDLVTALAHANAGLRWLPQYERPKEKPKAGTFAAYGVGVVNTPPVRPNPWGS
jgi:hypothetical protein